MIGVTTPVQDREEELGTVAPNRTPCRVGQSECGVKGSTELRWKSPTGPKVWAGVGRTPVWLGKEWGPPAEGHRERTRTDEWHPYDVLRRLLIAHEPLRDSVVVLREDMGHGELVPPRPVKDVPSSVPSPGLPSRCLSGPRTRDHDRDRTGKWSTNGSTV